MIPDRAMCVVAGWLNIALILSLICGPLILQADQLDRQSLFRIERNKNANIIQYDAQIRPDGQLDSNEPVIAYWIRLAEQGQVKKLSWIQRRFAYGFDTDFDQGSDRLTLDMTLDIGRPIRVEHDNGAYHATTVIDGKPSRIVKIYIHATGKGLSTKVNFIELYGTDLDDGGETYERFN